MEKYTEPERRQMPRLQERLPLLYRVLEILGSQELNDLIQTTAENIGSGGLMFITTQVLEEGTLLAMQVNKDVFSPIHLIGKVLWNKKIENSNSYQIGVQFLDLKDKCRKELINFVEERLKMQQEGAITTSIIIEDRIPFETMAAKEIIYFLQYVLEKEGICIELIEKEGYHLIRIRKKLGIRYGENF